MGSQSKGYYSKLARAVPLACLGFVLVACEQHTWTRDEIADIADDSIDTSEATSRIAALEDRVSELETELKLASISAEIAREDNAAIQDQVNKNARIANDNVLKDATAAGACGYSQFATPNGGLAWRPNECTAETYFKRGKD